MIAIGKLPGRQLAFDALTRICELSAPIRRDSILTLYLHAGLQYAA
jgi:hypothetical protein